MRDVPEQRQVQQNSQRAGISSEDDDLRCSAVQCFRGLVRTFLQLLVVRSLLDDIEDVLGEGFVGDGPGCFLKISFRLEIKTCKKAEKKKTNLRWVLRTLWQWLTTKDHGLLYLVEVVRCGGVWLKKT